MGPRRHISWYHPAARNVLRLQGWVAAALRKPKGDPREFKRLLKQWLGPGMTLPLTGIWWQCDHAGPVRKATRPSLSDQFMSWPCSPRLLVLLLSGTPGGTGMSLARGKRCSASTTSSLLSTLFSHWVPTHGTVPAAREAINAILARTSTRIRARIGRETQW